MSGGSMDYLYLRVREAEFHINSPERAAFRRHLMLVANALRSIEWNDSGDGDDQEVHNIAACISLSASENDKLRAENERLRAEVERLRADATHKELRRVYIVMEPDRGVGPMLGPVFASLEAAQRFLKSPEGRYRCYLYSEDGEEVEDGR